MTSELRFDGQVAVVTGAGGGLGREYALLLAARGAAVVVNDLGSARDGEGSNSRPADLVVQEIRDKGGKAVANYDSVEEGHKIVETAIEAFGRIDILINNAGFLRDRSVGKMEDIDWDLIHRVHLRAVFLTSRAAWPHLRRQKYGRIILTSSAAGLFGNFGQANYSAAKLGLVGLGKTLALEGEKYNILTNILVPAAASRLTESVFPPQYLDLLRPAQVAPVVLYLCHSDCPVSGAVVEAAGGAAALYRWQRSAGIASTNLTPEHVRDHWDELADFSRPEYPASPGEQMLLLGEQIAAAAGDVTSDDVTSEGQDPPLEEGQVDVARALRTRLPAAEYTYGPQEVILYALATGTSLSDPDGLRFLYEGHENFAAQPMFASLFVNAVDLSRLATLPGFPMDLTQILHGEQYVELKKPLPTAGTFTTETKITDIVDKGDKGALVLIDVDATDSDGDPVAHVQMTVFVRGGGGFGGHSSSEHTIPCATVPNRRPDATLSQRTGTDQAALYRLCGDRNPLHIDPEFAALGGQPRPILHGLCGLGVSVRLITQKYAPSQPERVHKVKARFARPVLPGETLLVDTWVEPDNPNRVVFQTRVKERDATAISGGYVELRPADGGPAHQVTVQLASDPVFESLAQRVSAQPSLAKTTAAVIQFKVTKVGLPAADWVLDLRSVPGSVARGTVPTPDLTLTAEDSDLVDMFTGKVNPATAVTKGQLKFRGKVALLTKLRRVLATSSQM